MAQARHRSPLLTVDAIIAADDGRIVLIERKNPPPGWALPGGFVEYGETVEDACIREALEETSLRIKLVRQFHAYSDPARDARHHTCSIVFTATIAGGTMRAADDAREIGLFSRDQLPRPLAFDHGRVLDDYFQGRY